MTDTNSRDATLAPERNAPTSILHLEDSDLDAELIYDQLRRAGMAVKIERACDRAGYIQKLAERRFDLILADYRIPAFDGVEALEMARRDQPTAPFIFVTGALGEEVAIDTLKSGATDYVLKERLARLAPAVERALAEAQEKEQRRRAEERAQREAAAAKRAELELREADRRKDEFLATLAHELRNPLAPLRAGLEIMKLTGAGDDASRAMMERQLAQMVRLIDDLLDISRINRGTLDLQIEEVSIRAVVERAVETSRPLIERAGQHLSVVLPEVDPILRADAVRLSQVFANLLNNASKYSPTDGWIELRVRREDESLVVSVRDTGIGIPAGMLPRVFEMFTQIDRSSERSRGGLGIGLSLARKLVEMHGGEIDVHSEGVDRGSEFTVRLPAPAAELSIAKLSIANGEPSEVRRPSDRDAFKQEAAERAKPLRILVADDNLDAALTLAELLTIEGHQTRVAHDGLEAAAILRTFHADIAILDIGMPRLDGYAAARMIRQEPWGREVALIALTGWGQPKDKDRALQAGFDLHLVKPVDPAALNHAIHAAAERFRSR